MEQLVPIIAVLGGVFCIVSSVKNYDFFFNTSNRKAQRVISLLGRQKARIFYGVIGLIIAGAGLYLLMIVNF